MNTVTNQIVVFAIVSRFLLNNDINIYVVKIQPFISRVVFKIEDYLDLRLTVKGHFQQRFLMQISYCEQNSRASPILVQ